MARLDIDVVENLEVVGDEAHRSYHHLPPATGRELRERVEQVRAKPGLTCPALALERKPPFAGRDELGDELRTPEQLVAVRIALVKDPSGKTMCRKDHGCCFRVSKGAQSRPNVLGYRLQITWHIEPGLYEIEGNAPAGLGQRLLDPSLVAAGAHARVVRCEDEANHPVHAGLL